jgi:uncharacterized NAD(P)/FAD-binding protein YdhS
MIQPTPPGPSVAILGGGFAGTMLAIRLLDSAAPGLRITVVERRAELGRGVAYSAPDPRHLVNGPSSMFSLHEEDEAHFTRWTLARVEDTGWRPPAEPGEGFAPRYTFGSYVAEELARARRDARGRVAFRHLRAEALGLRATPGGVEVATDAGPLPADVAVLATGVHPLPPALPGLAAHPRLARGPWDAEAIARLAATQGDVLLIGASLSMVDAVASLEGRGFSGRHLAISRRGHLIEARREREVVDDFLAEGPLPRTARELLASVIAARRRLRARGRDWQELPAAIKPWLEDLWAGASDAERRRFVRHLRALWDVTIHPAAPPSFAALAAARDAGRFDARAARLVGLRPEGEGLAADLRWRGGGTQTRVFAGVVDCRGHQEHDWRRMATPLARDLLASGHARPHGTGFGLDATRDGRLLDAAGAPQRGLRAIGHPLRGVAWESSSIPEQRAQATALAARLLAELQPATAAAAE